jgi:predicted SAM-dependent methyltransferase
VNQPIRAEVDHCRSRLLKYCQGQGLDLGCGPVKIKPDAIGIDIGHPNADMIADARILKNYPDNHFDYVFSSHLLEELANTEATLKEWLRIIKDDGLIVLYQVDEEYYYPIGDARCNRSHVHHFTTESLWEIFKKIGGVSLVHSQRYGLEPYNEWSFELVVKKSKGVLNDPIHIETEAISILIPTLNRPKDMANLVKSVVDTAEDKNLIEVVFGIHADDLNSLQAVSDMANCGIKVRAEIIERYKDGKAHLAFFWNQLYKVTTAPIVGFFGDDVLFETPGWDIEVRKEFAKDRSVMVSCNDVHIQRGQAATLFFTHRTLHDRIGYYLNENFRRWFVDTFWSEAFKLAGKMHYREDIVTRHLSPDVFKNRVDSTYADMENLKHPDALIWNTDANRQEIARVVAIIKDFK